VEEMIVSKDGTQNDDEGGETDESAMTPEVKEFNVSGKNFSFEPALITVKKGDTVKITFDNTAGFHDFKIDEFSVATTQASSPDSQTVEFIAGKTGDFEYYCSVGNHRAQGMVGVLRVE
jgi:plastocyanin